MPDIPPPLIADASPAGAGRPLSPDLGAAPIDEAGILAAVAVIQRFSRPLLEFIGGGQTPMPLPSGDLTHILLDCLIEAGAAVPDRVGQWGLCAGRVTTPNCPKSLYKKGSWLQSSLGLIVDFNRNDLPEGFRITRTDPRPIAEYRPGPGKSRILSSPLLEMWQGKLTVPGAFADRARMALDYGNMKVAAAEALLVGAD